LQLGPGRLSSHTLARLWTRLLAADRHGILREREAELIRLRNYADQLRHAVALGAVAEMARHAERPTSYERRVASNVATLHPMSGDGRRLPPGRIPKGGLPMLRIVSALVLAIILLPAVAHAATASITAAWTDASDNETGFELERCQGTGCSTFGKVASPIANAQTYTDAGLAQGTAYCYRIRAVNSVGASAYSNIACATTAIQLPAGPTGLSVAPVPLP